MPRSLARLAITLVVNKAVFRQQLLKRYGILCWQLHSNLPASLRIYFELLAASVDWAGYNIVSFCDVYVSEGFWVVVVHAKSGAYVVKVYGQFLIHDPFILVRWIYRVERVHPRHLLANFWVYWPLEAFKYLGLFALELEGSVLLFDDKLLFWPA